MLKRIIPKGLRRDPFFYFGITSLILFFILVSFLKPKIFKKITGSELISSLSSQNLFLASGESFFIESPNLFFLQKNSLKAVSPPIMVTPKIFGSLIGATSESEARKEITEYTVREGDNLWNIAENFNISLDTLLWANDLNKNSIISPGQKLIILPVPGLIHHVQKGETLSQITQTYKADIDEIISFNEITNEKIFAGDILIIPDGVMPSKIYTAPQVPLASSYFICPIPSPCRITQGLHWYNAIDFSNGKCGEPVYAAAGGMVQRTGYGSVIGNFIRIEHPNGVITVYGHLSKILVYPGQKVLQGEIIGYTGYSGYTIPAGPSGCHLHFEVRGARNPFAY